VTKLTTHFVLSIGRFDVGVGDAVVSFHSSWTDEKLRNQNNRSFVCELDRITDCF